jgi:hypothetical protein
MSPAEIKASNEEAEAFAAYTARTHNAVDRALACAGRWAVAIVAGAWLGVHAINVIAEALQ